MALRLILWFVFFIASFALLRYQFWGPSQSLVPMHSPVNAESVIAVSFILLVLLKVPAVTWPQPAVRSRQPNQIWNSPVVAVAGIASVTILAFSASLNIPLLHDSYGHVANAARASLADVLSGFYRHPQGGVLFFRPLGYFSFWLDVKWASFLPLRWHLWNLGLHIINSALVYAVARQISIERRSAFLAGLIFAIHGSRPEVVSWVAARFDLLAALFVLLSLFAFNKFSETTDRRWLLATLVCAPLALLSKESAFCLPLLIAGMLPFKTADTRRKLVSTIICVFGIVAITFAYRYWVLKGIGGYQQSGAASILQFNPVHAIKGLFFREWAFLFFPLNWSVSPGPWVKLSVFVLLLALCGVLLYSQAQRKYLFTSLFLVLAASLPVQHLLLISQDLNGGRVLYLPVLGISLFFAYAAEGCRKNWIWYAVSLGFLTSQLGFLEHNLSIWRQAAFLSQKTCHSFGDQLSHISGNVVVAGLPATWHGIYFLKNGFPACVAMNSQVPASRVFVEEDSRPKDGSAKRFTWDAKLESLQEQTR